MATFVHHGPVDWGAKNSEIRMKILIADDDLFFRNLLTQILAPHYEIVVTSDGRQAWTLLQEPQAPRLAILDWVMPGLSGPEICRKVRASRSLPPAYLIILTAKNSTADIVAGLRAGADDYITKPPVSAELLARVRMAERILSLQDAVAAQEVFTRHLSGRESRLRCLLADCSLCRRLHDQGGLSALEDYLSQPHAPSNDPSASCADRDFCLHQLSASGSEHSHS
jgi:CheY-like chemotaxis protein